MKKIIENKKICTKKFKKFSSKILIISTCQHKLHENEFIIPITKLIKNEFEIINYKNINQNNIKNYEKIIISGTALKDFDYLNYLENFNFIKTTNKEVLGICAGFQIIGKLFNCKIRKSQEIGFINIENFKNNKLLIKGTYQTYCLHNNSLEINSNFEILAKSQTSTQIIKLKNKEIYGILFHPEVRNNEIINNFINN